MYEAKNFDHLLGTPGFSDTLLKNHFALYEGYVKNCNALHELSGELRSSDKLGSFEYAELKRRQAWEFNGMRLHELYFGNMKKDATPLGAESSLGQKLGKQYGDLVTWEKVFRADAAIRGIGWVMLTYDKVTESFRDNWVNEHDVGILVGTTPLLVMDVFEHAYITDYGIKRADYIEAFMKAIDWSVVEQRFLA